MTKLWPPPLPPERCGLKIELHPRVKLWPEKTFMDWCPECQDWFPDRQHKCPHKDKKKPALAPTLSKPATPLIDDSLLPANPPWARGMNKKCTQCAKCIMGPDGQLDCTDKPEWGGYRTSSGCKKHKPGSFKIVNGYTDRIANADRNKKSKGESK
jgi:hypothetical protein